MIIKLYEKFTEITDIKEIIIEKAIESGEVDMVKFFIKKGYDVDFDNAINFAAKNEEMLKLLLENKVDFKRIVGKHLKSIDVQKVLIDFGEEDYIYNTVGFHKELKYDPKYADVVAKYDQMSKFNI